MAGFRFKDDEKAKAAKKPWFRIAVISSGVAVILGLGSTLAANINLNAGGAVEFGQGVTQTAVCNGSSVDLILTPISTFLNSSSPGYFAFKGFQVSNLPDTCNGNTFKFSFYGSEPSPLDPIGYDWCTNGYVTSACPNMSYSNFDNTHVSVKFNRTYPSDTSGVPSSSGNFSTPGGVNDGNLWDDNRITIANKSETSFQVLFNFDGANTPAITAANLERITVETSGSNQAPDFSLVNSGQNRNVGDQITPIGISSTGGYISEFILAGSLPSGISMNSRTGEITGTIANDAASGSYNFTVTGKNAFGSQSQTGSITVGPTLASFATLGFLLLIWQTKSKFKFKFRRI